ncbi:MAG: 4-(cytidine 5'-diphospho)-2-C-methyl-D-erythritol kinase [Verrucomicrobiales bacterium]
MSYVERALAKINLSLRVLSKRDDGCHEIETLMVPLSGVEDVLNFDLQTGQGDVKLRCDDAHLPVGEDNLVMRAMRTFCSRTSKAFCGEIELKKQIPSGAGLGGGSSDAAATLRALNKLSDCNLSLAELRSLAGEIGSDVAFFVEPGPSLCAGRGEFVSPFTGEIPRLSVILLKPAFSVSTGWAYSMWAQSECLPEVDYAVQSASWGDVFNDLERPVFSKYLILAAMKTWLMEQSETQLAMMSGSGSTVFAILHRSDEAAPLMARAVAEFGASTWVITAAIGEGGGGA